MGDHDVWAELGPILWRPPPLDLHALGFAPLAGRPVLVVGPGHGWEVRDLLSAFPDAEVLAVEPDAAMRTALVSLLFAGCARDVDRVTVLPRAVEDLPDGLPPCGGALLRYVAPSVPDWSTLFSAVRGHLVTGAPLLVSRLPAGGLSHAVPPRLMTERRLGRVHYQRWYERFSGPGGPISRNTYVARLGDVEIARHETESRIVALSEADLLTSASDAGFTLVGEPPDHWLLLAR